MRDSGLKIGCTPSIWQNLATQAALEAGLSPRQVLAGKRDAPHTLVRWGVWRKLVDAGYSYYSIGRASGFDHTSVMHAHKAQHPPRLWKSRKVENEQARG